METGFRPFGALHILILAATIVVPWLLARTKPSRRLFILLGAMLAVNELAWYAYRFLVEGWRFPDFVPLQLCDLSVWLTAIAALTGAAAVFDLAYYLGVAGAGMALITPDLWAPCWSYPTLYFWAAHCGIVGILLLMIFSGAGRPRPGSVWRALLVGNIFALAAGLFNWAFHTNYMYLREKPAAGSLLDFLGPWPWYILAGEAMAFVLFGLLWLPFRRRAA